MLPFLASFVAGSELAAPLLSLARTLADEPNGEYVGDKDVLGHHIHAVMIYNTDGTLDFELSGVLAVDCKNEPFTMQDHWDGDRVVLTNTENSDDCIKSTLEENHAKLESIEYDADRDELTLHVHYRFIGVEVHLHKTPAASLAELESHHHHQPTIMPGLAIEEEHEVLGEEWNPWSTPSGFYKGYKDFYGYQVWANSTFSIENGKPNMEINLHGKEKIHCKHEGYDLVMQKPPMKQLILPGWGLVLDCFTEYMKANSAELASMLWNAQSNVLTVNQNLKGHTMSINLYHQNSEEEEAENHLAAPQFE